MKTSVKTSIGLLVPVVCTVLTAAVMPVRADKSAKAKVSSRGEGNQEFVIRAQGHPRFVDFTARSAKRADLRMEVARKGVDAAFTEWLRAEHPHVYRRHQEQEARASRKPGGETVAARPRGSCFV